MIGGIILGPTVLGRVPGFTEHVFPPQSLPYLNLISTIGLVLFLFIVGLEVELSIIRRDWRVATAISFAGLCLPFGVGCGIAVPIYNTFVDVDNVTFGHFLLFVGVALSITAFPVLCRILTETKLLETRVGVIVLSAGVGNDVVGWILLALTIALVNASTGVVAVYILLLAVGWTIIVLWPIKRAFLWLCRRSGCFDDHHGPTPGVMLVLLLLVFASAFFTDVIGVHPIFGGFLVGLIVPHEHGFARKVTERLDDLVALLFLPIYFVLSGLKTNLGLLDNGVTWGYTIAIIVVAFFGKFIGCAATAKAVGFGYRESGAIGTLMSCKGLVELIVLNVGLSANILDQRLFSMFVFMAIICTIATTPLTLWVYPPRYHEKVSSATTTRERKISNADGTEAGRHASMPSASGVREHTDKLLIVLQKYEHLSAVMFLMQLLEPSPVNNESRDALTRVTTSSSASPVKPSVSLEKTASGSDSPVEETMPSNRPHIQALRLTELTGRTHSVMQSIETDTLARTDELLQLTRQCGELRGFDVDTRLSVINMDSYAATVVETARDTPTELLIVPWTTPDSGASGAVMEENHGAGGNDGSNSPFDTIFGNGNQSQYYSHFLRRVFAQSTVDVALFIDRGFSAAATSHGHKQHLFLPFFGGPDDRLALALVVQLCRQSNVTATVIRFASHQETLTEPETAITRRRTTSEVNKEASLETSMALHTSAYHQNFLTAANTPVRGRFPSLLPSQRGAVSSSNDDLTWAYFAEGGSPAMTVEQRRAIERIHFSTINTNQPLQTVIERATDAVERTANGSWRPLVIITGRSRREGAPDLSPELTRMLSLQSYSPAVGAEIRKTTGDVATALVTSGTKAATASFLVVQSAS